MELTAAAAEAYLRKAGRQIIEVADRVGDEKLNLRPGGPSTNSVGGLVAHCLGVMEFWLGHAALGRASDRDRDAEFSTQLTVNDVHERLRSALEQAAVDLRRIEDEQPRATHPWAFDLPGGTGPASVVVHVVEEIFQHLGHMQITADVLLDA